MSKWFEIYVDGEKRKFRKNIEEKVMDKNFEMEKVINRHLIHPLSPNFKMP